MKAGSTEKVLTEEQKKIMDALVKGVAPCGSKEIAAATGLDAKVVSSRIAEMKKEGLLDSPERCKYGLTDEGKEALLKATDRMVW